MTNEGPHFTHLPHKRMALESRNGVGSVIMTVVCTQTSLILVFPGRQLWGPWGENGHGGGPLSVLLSPESLLFSFDCSQVWDLLFISYRGKIQDAVGENFVLLDLCTSWGMAS